MISRGLKTHLYKAIAIVALLSVVGIGLPVNETLRLQQAEAQLPVTDPLNLVQSTLSAVSLGSIELKEFTLDGIAYALAKKAVSQMTSNIVEWINSGFQGSPMFVTDLGGFLTNIADQVAGDYIAQIGDGFLCSPFELNVRAALEIQYQKSKSGSKTQCTFSGVVENLENFATGFTSWSDWFEITTKPQNNQYGALLIAQTELDVSISNAQGQEIKLLDYGQGFLSMKKCEDVAGGGQTCKIVTPGATIKEQLDQHLGSGLASLIEADEIDEIINALIAQLAEQAVTGVNGLLGLSQSNGSNGSYLNQINRGEGGTVGFSYASKSNPIQKGIENETKSANIQREIIELINDVEDEIDASCPLDLSDDLADARDDAETELASSNVILGTLNTLSSQYINTSDPSLRNDLYLDYLELESAGYLHSSFDVIGFETTLADVELEVEDFEEEIKDECD